MRYYCCTIAEDSDCAIAVMSVEDRARFEAITSLDNVTLADLTICHAINCTLQITVRQQTVKALNLCCYSQTETLPKPAHTKQDSNLTFLM